VTATAQSFRLEDYGALYVVEARQDVNQKACELGEREQFGVPSPARALRHLASEYHRWLGNKKG
jgi:hypothetical protein